jgi:hypothetical protein
MSLDVIADYNAIQYIAMDESYDDLLGYICD